MKFFKVYRNSLFLTIFIIFLFVSISFGISAWISHIPNGEPFHKPDIFFARLVHQLSPEDHIKGVAEFDRLSDSQTPFQLSLVDANGRVLFSHNPDISLQLKDWDPSKLPSLPFQPVTWSDPMGERGGLPLGMPPGPPPLGAPPGPPPQGGPGPGGPGLLPPLMKQRMNIVLLPGEPKQYLVISDRRGAGPPTAFAFISMVLMIGAVILGLSVSFYFIFKAIKDKLTKVDEFILRLKAGDLKARIQVSSNDEVSAMMIRFNQMADEIEHLVENIRRTEKSRVLLLQELAHDLRTPIASLKSMLETLHDLAANSGAKMNPKTQQEIHELCLSEVNYFQVLVEDLLFLAQMSEPRYQIITGQLNMNEIVSSVLKEVRLSQKNIQVEFEPTNENDTLIGDEHLLKRLFKNTLKNAGSFANSRIKIEIKKVNSIFDITITDDGPGFEDKNLVNFGERRITRIYNSQNSKRVSVGLGSVIMKTIVDLHRGTLRASNITNAQSQVLGAQIKISLPTA